jgi:hypothetical protein
MFGKNRERNTRILAIVLGVVVIASMLFSYFSLLF